MSIQSLYTLGYILVCSVALHPSSRAGGTKGGNWSLFLLGSGGRLYLVTVYKGISDSDAADLKFKMPL